MKMKKIILLHLQSVLEKYFTNTAFSNIKLNYLHFNHSTNAGLLVENILSNFLYDYNLPCHRSPESGVCKCRISFSFWFSRQPLPGCSGQAGR